MTQQGQGGPTTALVANPVKVGDVEELCELVSTRLAELDLPPVRLYETTEADPGAGQARAAVDAGATLVLVAGGDGTVRATVEGVVGTGVPLGVLPQGTGNLLARNLGIPVQTATALDVALAGADRRIDVGRLEVESRPRPPDPELEHARGNPSIAKAEDDAESGTVFAVMAGAGFDATMMREAPEGLKHAVGWPAYLVGGLRSMRQQRMHVVIEVDGGAPVTGRVRTVLVANLGRLQGGLEVLSDAAPDDGLLDVALVSPRRPLDWLVLLVRATFRRHRPDHRLRTFQGRHITVRLKGRQPRQLDGDLIADGTTLSARVDPGALVVRVPRPLDEETP